jgi:hypothetical protein
MNYIFLPIKCISRFEKGNKRPVPFLELEQLAFLQ